MNNAIETTAAIVKLASKLGVGTIVSNAVEMVTAEAELGAVKQTCKAIASLTISGAVSMYVDKYIDKTAEEADKFVTDMQERVKEKQAVVVEVDVPESNEDTQEVEEKPKKTSKKKKKEEVKEPEVESKEETEEA